MQKSNNESYIQKNGYQEQMKVLLNNSVELQIRKFEWSEKVLQREISKNGIKNVIMQKTWC